MATKKRAKRYDEGGDIEVVDRVGRPVADIQADEEAAFIDEQSSKRDAEKSRMDMDRGEAILKSMRDKPAASMVTKEQLAKSGLSLRDYMNKQQGLTRRGESKTDTTAKDSIASTYRPAPKDAKERIAKEALSSIQASGRKYPDMSALQAPAKPSGMTAMAANMARRKIDQNKDTSYKSGGSVSSASKRADGIATKGKTRGKLC